MILAGTSEIRSCRVRNRELTSGSDGPVVADDVRCRAACETRPSNYGPTSVVTVAVGRVDFQFRTGGRVEYIGGSTNVEFALLIDGDWMILQRVFVESVAPERERDRLEAAWVANPVVDSVGSSSAGVDAPRTGVLADDTRRPMVE